LSTFCGRKYGRLDVIQNPAYDSRVRPPAVVVPVPKGGNVLRLSNCNW